MVAGRREDDGLLPGAVHHLVVSMIVGWRKKKGSRKGSRYNHTENNTNAPPTPTASPYPQPLPLLLSYIPNLVEQQQQRCQLLVWPHLEGGS